MCVFFLHLQLFFSFFILQVVWKYLHCYNFKCKNQLSCILKTFIMHSKTFQTTIRHFVDIWTILQHFFLKTPKWEFIPRVLGVFPFHSLDVIGLSFALDCSQTISSLFRPNVSHKPKIKVVTHWDFKIWHWAHHYGLHHKSPIFLVTVVRSMSDKLIYFFYFDKSKVRNEIKIVFSKVDHLHNEMGPTKKPTSMPFNMHFVI